MNLTECILSRRSIRKYKQINISDDIILELIDSARLCQSAKNRQPWFFKILRNEEKQKIAELMHQKIRDARLENFNSSVENSASIIENAPVLILVFKEKDDQWITSDMLSIGACIEHICLKSVDIGLGSLWIRDVYIAEKEILEETGNGNLELVSGITIGIPDECPSERPRKSINDIILL